MNQSLKGKRSPFFARIAILRGDDQTIRSKIEVEVHDDDLFPDEGIEDRLMAEVIDIRDRQIFVVVSDALLGASSKDHDNQKPDGELLHCIILAVRFTI